MERPLPGDAQLEALSDEEKIHLLEKPLSQRRMPSAEFIKDRIARAARRKELGLRLPSKANFWGEWRPIAGGASYVTVTLDTTGPGSPSISISGGAAYATSQTVTVTIGTADSDTTGYQMKVYGDVDTSNDSNVQATKAASTWISYATSKSIKLSSGDGSKTVYVTIRDDVWNESSEASDAITLDTTLPTVTVQGGSPDVSRVSKISGKRTVNITWQSNQQYDEYKVKVVPSTGSNESAGTTIGTTNGSSNVAGSTADQPASTNVTTTIDGRDLEAASAGDGDKIIKIFVKDDAGNWST